MKSGFSCCSDLHESLVASGKASRQIALMLHVQVQLLEMGMFEPTEEHNVKKVSSLS